MPSLLTPAEELKNYLDSVKLNTQIKPTSSGQYAVTMFDPTSAVKYKELYNGYGGKSQTIDSPTIQNRLNKFKVNSTTAFVTNKKPTLTELGQVDAPETLEDNFWGSRTGKNAGGIKAIANAVKNKASALPRNELIAMHGFTPELNQKYGQIAQKVFPNRFFQGNSGINYIAPQGMTPGVMKWLSKILPGANLTSIPSAANLYNNIKQQGPTQGYMKWLGFDAQPRKWY